MAEIRHYLKLHHLKHRFRSFGSGAMGNVSVMLAVAVIPVTIAGGMAVDFARSYHTKTDLQIALDAASLAAASAYDKTDGERTQLAKDMFAINFAGVASPPVPNVSFSDDEVTVTAAYSLNASFMKLSGTTYLDVTGSSTAIAGSSAGPCVLTLDPSAKESIMLNSNSSIEADGCLVQVNSSDNEALVGNSDGDLTADSICVNGNWDSDGSSQFDPEPSHCSPISDPLASLPVPDEADDNCPGSNEDLSIDDSRTLQPGVYCKKLEIKDGANVTLAPGIFVMRDGELIVNSGATLTGTNVMIYLTGTQDNPRFNINSGSHIELHGRQSGTYAGMVIFQARDAVADYSILNSDSTSIIEGVVYLPNSPLHLNSNGNVSDNSPWTAIVSQTLELNSDSTLHINTDYASSSVPAPFGIGGDPAAAQPVRLKN